MYQPAAPHAYRKSSDQSRWTRVKRKKRGKAKSRCADEMGQTSVGIFITLLVCKLWLRESRPTRQKSWLSFHILGAWHCDTTQWMSDMVLALPVLGFVLLRFAPFLTCSTKPVPPSSKLVSDIPTILESNSLRFSVMLGSIIRPTVLASTHPHLLRVLVSTSLLGALSLRFLLGSTRLASHLLDCYWSDVWLRRNHHGRGEICWWGHDADGGSRRRECGRWDKHNLDKVLGVDFYLISAAAILPAIPSFRLSTFGMGPWQASPQVTMNDLPRTPSPVSTRTPSPALPQSHLCDFYMPADGEQVVKFEIGPRERRSNGKYHRFAVRKPAKKEEENPGRLRRLIAWLKATAARVMGLGR